MPVTKTVRDERIDSVTSQFHPMDLDKFNSIVDNCPYIQEWGEIREEVWGEAQGEEYISDISDIKYVLVFPKSLEVTDQVFSSVAEFLGDSDLRVKIQEQHSDEMIVTVDKLADNVYKQWFYNEFGRHPN